jgi:hypothetical protein
MRRASLCALALLLFGCQRSNEERSLGTMRLGAKVDPKFDEAWRALAARTDDQADVFYIEDDRAEGMMARVRRNPRTVPVAPPTPPATTPAVPEGEPDQPSGEAISAAVRANLPAIKACYLRLTRQGKLINGRAILSFTVERDGTAKNVRVDAPAFMDSDLPRCMSLQVTGWSFPRSKKGGFEVSYPFVFMGQ